MTASIASITGHLAMFQAVTAECGKPEPFPDFAGEAAAHRQAEKQERDADDQREAHRQVQGPQLPGRPPLVDFVDPIHGATERGDKRRSAPQCQQRTEHQCQAGATRLGQLLDRCTQAVGDALVAEVADQLEDRVGGLLRFAHHADQRRDHDERGEGRQHRVVRQRGRQVCALVALELGDRPLRCVLPRLRGEVRW